MVLSGQEIRRQLGTNIVKLARTIADLEAADQIGVVHIAEAVQYRLLDREY